MRRRILSLCALCLALVLSGCGGGDAKETPMPSTPAPVKTPAPAAVTPSPAPSAEPLGGFAALPVTEAEIERLYAQEGYAVLELTNYDGDFLVWYSDAGKALDSGGDFHDWSSFAWIFAETGRRVRMPVDGIVDSYQITGPGSLSLTTTGESAITAFRGFPGTATLTVLGDEDGMTTDDETGLSCVSNQDTAWLPVEAGARLGLMRKEVVYDARVGLNDLSVCFIPPAEANDFGNFIAGSTSIPSTAISFNEVSRVLTIRMQSVSLDSGPADGGLDDSFYDFSNEYGIVYPHTFPAGTLGPDNRFFTDPTIAVEGEDTVITLTLTDAAYRYTVETGQLSTGDMYPYLRVSFREHIPYLDDEF